MFTRLRAILAPGALALLVLPPNPVEAQAAAGSGETLAIPSPLPIHRLAEPLELTETADASVWDEIDPLPLTMFAPTFGAPMTEDTEIRVAHDDEYLYVSGRMYDSDPDGIRVNTFYRDQFSGDDLLAVVIDSYDDHETAVWFTVNPAGTRTDRSVANDAVGGAGGSPMNLDWDAHWDVATSQSDEGWFAEIRIPFSTLGFQVRDGEVTMGLIVYRIIARKNERQIFPAIDPAAGGLAWAKPSQAHRVVLRGVDPPRSPFYVTPYAVGGLKQLRPEGAGEGGGPFPGLDSDPTGDVGVDVRYSPSTNLSVDVTLNTDFAQVEADEQQVNLTRFPLFFPEKRQFFQERSSTFEFATGQGRDRLFHSRRIGLVDGEIMRIYGGARAVGRLDGTDFGFISMQTERPGGSGTENASVFRVSQEVLNPYSSVGAILTSRLGSGGRDNVAYGLDSTLRPFGDEWVTLRWARSYDERIEEASELEAGLVRARWERIQDDGFSYFGEFVRVGRDYEPGLGFQSRRDYRSFGGRAQYKRYQDAESPFRSIGARVGTRHFLRNEDGTAASRSIDPQIDWEFKGGTQLGLSLSSSYEDIQRSFSIAEVEIPVGDYWFHEVEFSFQRSRNALFRGSYSATAGSFYDGSRVGISLDPEWTQSRYLEIGAGYEVNRLSFSDRDVATTTHLARLQLRVALNTQLSFSTLAQYSNVADLASVNARFRYHIREGNDLWIVYNEGWDTEREYLRPAELPRTMGRSLMIKYTHTFAQ